MGSLYIQWNDKKIQWLNNWKWRSQDGTAASGILSQEYNPRGSTLNQLMYNSLMLILLITIIFNIFSIVTVLLCVSLGPPAHYRCMIIQIVTIGLMVHSYWGGEGAVLLLPPPVSHSRRGKKVLKKTKKKTVREQIELWGCQYITSPPTHNPPLRIVQK